MLLRSHQSELYSQQEEFEHEYSDMTHALTSRIESKAQSTKGGMAIAAEELAELREMIRSLKKAVQDKQIENINLKRKNSLEMNTTQHVDRVGVSAVRHVSSPTSPLQLQDDSFLSL